MPDRLNELTRAEIEDIRSQSARETRPCAWCDKPHLMRADQHFCSAKCRAAYAAGAARTLREAHAHEREAWRIEREGLVKEIARLQELLKEA